MNTFKIQSLEQINQVAKDFLNELGPHQVIALYGPMGVGKTTFVKALCEVLQVNDTVNSPSFAIVNEYETAQAEKIYHFDFYRLKNVEEAYDMGYEDYFYSGNLCLIEWPEKIDSILPANRIDLIFEELPDGSRKLTVQQG